MRAVRLEYEPEHRNKWRRRRIVLFGRSIPLATTALLATTVLAFAWGGFLLTQATARTTIQVAPAPVALNISYPTLYRKCVKTSGAGAASGSWDAGSNTWTCSVTGFDDTSRVEVELGLQNDESFSVNVLATMPVDTSCINITVLQSPVSSLAPGVNTTARFEAKGIPNDTGTLSCAGTTLPDLDIAYEVSD